MLPRPADSREDDDGVRRAVLAVGLSASMACALAVAPAAGADDLVVHEETVLFGSSVDGRPLVAVHRWSAGARRTTLVLGSMHGDERAGTLVVRRLRTLPLPAGVDLWLVPTMNPDGAAAGVRTNAHSVDLNRNFPRYWERAGAGTGTWSGPSPASESETRAVQTLLRSLDARTVLSFHQPLHAVDSYRAKSLALVRRLARALELPVRSLDCSGGCHGTLTDWANHRLDGRAVTVELGRAPDAARLDAVAAAVLRVATPH
jgi:murein peptide amidase A